jgi:hypothetical protein
VIRSGDNKPVVSFPDIDLLQLKLYEALLDIVDDSGMPAQRTRRSSSRIQEVYDYQIIDTLVSDLAQPLPHIRAICKPR